MSSPGNAALATAAILLALPQHLLALGWSPAASLMPGTARRLQMLPVPPVPFVPIGGISLQQNCQCGVAGQDVIDTRIVGGDEVAPHIFPWMVAILFDGYMNCGGSLINDRYVLTAGHCVHGLNVQNVTVMVGMNDLLTKSRLLPPVERLILHEEYTRDYLHDINDIALIKLAMPVAFSSFVSPICLPQNEAVDYTGNLAIVAGWGRVGQDEPLARYLRATEVRVISNEVCRNTAIGEHISDSMLCTYLEKKDACQGDSGGPLAAVGIDGHFEQIGVVSWGIGCARVNMPGVFTRVTKFMNWLRYNTRDANYCSRN